MPRETSYFIAVLKLIRFGNLLILGATQYFAYLFLFPEIPALKQLIEPWGFHLLVISTAIIAAGGYIINDYHDVKIDAINKPKAVLVGRLFPRRELLVTYLFINVIALIIGLYLGWLILALHLMSIFLLWVYSAYLKKTSFWGNFLVALLTGLAVMLVSIYFRAHYFELGLYASLAFFLTLIREIIKDMEDIKGDAAFGSRSLPIVYGIRKSKQFVYIIIGVFLSSLIAFEVFIEVWAFNIIVLVLILEIVILVYYIYWADTKDKYHFCSQLCKAILLSGVLSMIWVN